MGPKTGRRVRKREVLTDSVPEFKLGDTVADIHQRREEREEAQLQKRGSKEGGDKSGGIALARGGTSRKKVQDRKR